MYNLNTNVDYSIEALAVVLYREPDTDPVLSGLLIQQCCGSGSARIWDFLARSDLDPK